MSEHKNSTFALGLFLALGLIVSAYIISSTFKDIKSSDQTITVKGYAEKNISSDFASWNCRVSVTSTDLNSAYSKLAVDFETVKNYLNSNGFSDNQLQINTVYIQKNFEWNEYGRTDRIIGYTLERSITIESEDILKIKTISTKSSELIKQGIEFISGNPNYYYTKLDDLKIEMLAAATKDAKQRAETLAENSGSKVGELKSARQGVFQITAANSNNISDYGVYNTAAIDKTIKSVVTVDFKIK